MFEKELRLPARFVVGEKYSQCGDSTRFHVSRRTPCYVIFLTNDGDTYKKKVRYDLEGNEYVEWKNEIGDVYVLGTWHNENSRKS